MPENKQPNPIRNCTLQFGITPLQNGFLCTLEENNNSSTIFHRLQLDRKSAKLAISARILLSEVMMPLMKLSCFTINTYIGEFSRITPIAH